MMRICARVFLLAILAVALATTNDSYGQVEVDKEIQELRDKLSRLEQQQIEIKKEATARQRRCRRSPIDRATV